MRKTRRYISILLVLVATLTGIGFVAMETIDDYPQETVKAETETIIVPTREIAPDVFILPWETPYEKGYANSISGVYLQGPYVEVDVFVVNSIMDYIPMNENEVTLVTCGELLLVIRVEKDGSQYESNDYLNPLSTVTAPLVRVLLEIRDREDSRIFYGTLRIGARVVANGTSVALHHYTQYTYIQFRPGNSDLRIQSMGSVGHATREARVIVTIRLTRHNGESTHLSAWMAINANGNIASTGGGTRV